MMPFGPKPVPEHRWFESKSLAARLFIMIAGVVMNVVLAFVVFVDAQRDVRRADHPVARDRRGARATERAGARASCSPATRSPR